MKDKLPRLDYPKTHDDLLAKQQADFQRWIKRMVVLLVVMWGLKLTLDILQAFGVV